MRQTTTNSDNRKPGLDNFFHSMEKSRKCFSYCGKLLSQRTGYGLSRLLLHWAITTILFDNLGRQYSQEYERFHHAIPFVARA
jgi:hypothetical protein